MALARVFPRQTNATPTDPLAFYGLPPQDFPEEITEAHVSVTFTYDIPAAEKLAMWWEKKVPTKLGGVAYGDPGGEFTPGRYIAPGYVITSRGCPNNCWFCDAWKREGRAIRELPVTEGWNLLDSNILACSMPHIEKVFAMLEKQTMPVEFTGGLEAARLTPKIVDMLWRLRPKSMFFAYDTPNDYEPLVEAGKLLRYADFTRSHMHCYVLVGYRGDTLAKAEKRLVDTWSAGFMPCCMLYRDEKGEVTEEWKKLQRSWIRPPATKAMLRGTTELWAGGIWP